MCFRLVSKSVTLNDLERRNEFGMKFTEFGKLVFQHITTSICGEFMHESIVHRVS